jgi:four helix bundle protein
MCRCSVSIPSNIAEGCGRAGNGELHRFLQIAAGSASELEYQLLLAHDLKYMGESDYERMDIAVCEVKRMLASLANKIEADRAAD